MPVIKRIPLTKAFVDTAKVVARSYRVWDSKVPGLALRVHTSGRKTYELHWGRNRALTIGQHGAFSLEAARGAAQQVLGEVATHGVPKAQLRPTADEAAATTFGEFIETRYGPYVQSTAKAGKATLMSLRAHFGHLFVKRLANISRADFDAFKAKRLNNRIHPATVNRDLDRLKAALSKAMEWGLIPSNPLVGVRRIKRNTEGRLRFLSRYEEVSLRAALQRREDTRRARRESGDRWRQERGYEQLGQFDGYTDHVMPMTLLALNTGLRRGELTQLVWRDIDLDAKRLTVRAGYAKSGKSRHIPLNSEAVQVLRQCRVHLLAETPLFDVKSLPKAWGSLMAEAGIKDFRFHDLRHTFASKLAMAGVDLNTVRELLGHGDIKMTLRYAHLAPEHKAAAVELLVP